MKRSHKVRRNFTTIRGKLGHDLLVQPDVHVCRVAGVSGVAKLLRKLLARGQAGVNIKRFHQVDDRTRPTGTTLFDGDCYPELTGGCRGKPGVHKPPVKLCLFDSWIESDAIFCGEYG
jgi:hypothetical protein